jgi:Gas vesicle synthesis protein GvpO
MADSSSSNKRRNSGAKSQSARDVIERVREELPELLGRPIESILGVERSDDNGWGVTVAVVELSRIPSSTDVMGAYRVSLTQDGELQGYQRVRRYNRNQTGED